jgi:hypothetical protein
MGWRDLVGRVIAAQADGSHRKLEVGRRAEAAAYLARHTTPPGT